MFICQTNNKYYKNIIIYKQSLIFIKYKRKDQMGGNAFEDVQRITPQQYQQLINYVTSKMMAICVRIEPYIPFPQKQSHGDIDFMVLLKEGFSEQDIIKKLQLNKKCYIIHNNSLINTLINKKQIDFKIVKNQQQFQWAKVYHSYSGIGALLGLLFPSRILKFTQTGLYCLYIKQNTKLQINVAQNISDVFKFYGLDYDLYFKSFKTKKQLLQFIKVCKFYSKSNFLKIYTKQDTKLIRMIKQYSFSTQKQQNQFYEQIKDPLEYALNFFNKKQYYYSLVNQKQLEMKNLREIVSKWNGSHIIKIFKIEPKKVDKLKIQFQNSFKYKDEYEKYIRSHELKQIAILFSQICKVQIHDKQLLV